MDTEKILNQIVTLVVIPILPVVSTYVVTWFKKKTEEIQLHMENERVEQYLKILNNTVDDVIKALNQTTVEGLKLSSADGKLTKEEAESIKKTAINEVYKILGKKGKEVLQTIFSDLDSLISNKIESNVNTLKLQKK